MIIFGMVLMGLKQQECLINSLFYTINISIYS